MPSRYIRKYLWQLHPSERSLREATALLKDTVKVHKYSEMTATPQHVSQAIVHERRHSADPQQRHDFLSMLMTDDSSSFVLLICFRMYPMLILLRMTKPCTIL
jgi:hypothetical protein